jgi:2-(1,2-epoxy-1,2-dihydrophenyl)acetyl-CoA isomerase
MSDFTVTSHDVGGRVAVVEFGRGDANFFSVALVDAIADTLEDLARGEARAVVLTSAGRHFCAGADFTGGPEIDATASASGRHLYDAALRLFRQELPIVAVVQGGAIGGGLGLALACDFRVAAADARFAAPFARLGLHHGFGLTVTLPLVVGHQRAIELLYTARRVQAPEALRMGLCDEVVPLPEAREAGIALAREIALGAPIALRSIRRTMRGRLADQVAAATEREKAEQALHARTADFAEGVSADLARRTPAFTGR